VSAASSSEQLPVAGLSNSGSCGCPPKSNIRPIEPAAWSVASLPRAGTFQLSSMNFTTELWSSSESST